MCFIVPAEKNISKTACYKFWSQIIAYSILIDMITSLNFCPDVPFKGYSRFPLKTVYSTYSVHLLYIGLLTNSKPYICCTVSYYTLSNIFRLKLSASSFWGLYE